MIQAMKELRKRYNVPAKRGMYVQHGDEHYRITSSDGYYVYALDEETGTRYKFHPFDVSYQIKFNTAAGIWEYKSGKELKAAFDARIDAWNQRRIEYIKRQIAQDAENGTSNRIPGPEEVEAAFGL